MVQPSDSGMSAADLTWPGGSRGQDLGPGSPRGALLRAVRLGARAWELSCAPCAPRVEGQPEQQPGGQGLSVRAELPRGPGCSAGSCVGCALASGAHCHKKCRAWWQHCGFCPHIWAARYGPRWSRTDECSGTCPSPAGARLLPGSPGPAWAGVGACVRRCARAPGVQGHRTPLPAGRSAERFCTH